MSKGRKSRVSVLPLAVQPDLQRQLSRAKLVHEQDLAVGFGKVYFPRTLAQKYPWANQEWI